MALDLRQTVEASIRIAARPEAAWRTIADFARMDRWLPGIEMQPSENPDAERIFEAGGNIFKERLERLDGSSRSLQYSLLEGPLPVRSYLATVEVAAANMEQSVVTWKASFVSTSEPPEKSMKIVRRGLEGALANLKRFLEQTADTARTSTSA